ncbi:MAG TPA: membrane-bound lytic murein transglycosylase MltF [Usitatibacter sp.]|nr:membrane-bound lytic murein transglycosylase MltF [Usitatibacter sp.]
MGARRFTGRIFALLACIAVGCEEAPRPIAPVAESGELVVLTVNGPSTYFEDAEDQPSGLEYDLVTMFAKELGAKARFVLVQNPATIDTILRKGQAHLAAAALPRHFDFPGGLAWGPSYLSTQHEVVCRDETKAKKLDELTGKRIGVIEETVADYLLTEPSKLKVPIERFDPETSTADLLEKVAHGSLDCALVESTRFTLARRYFPSLEPAFNVGKPLEYAWLVSPVDKKRILKAAGPFFERIRKDGTLKRLIDRYYSHAARLSAIDATALLEQVATQLDKLKPHFVEAEAASGIDWRLIAAIGYQESHWDPNATSPTGVRGLMMLTEDTADQLKVKDRLDVRDSIVAGARYLSMIKDQLPPRIAEPDRTFLALAAYNIGIGHLEDARILAQRSGLSPDKWQDVRQVISRLADPATYPSLKHGYARGGEAMQLVDNVRNYYDIISRMRPREAALEARLPADPQASSKDSAPPR